MSDDTNAIHNLLNLFRDEQQGLLFVKDSLLPEYTFIAIEAIWWSIEHCDDIQNEQTALNLFQVRKENLFIEKIKIFFFLNSFYLRKNIFDIVQIQKLVFVLDFFFIIL
jgi:hypothetical protein